MSTHPEVNEARDRRVDAADRTRPAADAGGDRTRSVQREIRIAAPPDVVWKALTDAEELRRWFPLEARVTPGPGGRLWMRWDATELDDTRIDVWEPERHLRTTGTQGGWAGLATDYYLRSAEGGTTVLRVVSSGFGSGEDWDELLEAYGEGWDFELRGLRHYLERHRGRDRVVAWARAPYTVSHEEAWARITSPGGWFGERGLRELAEGRRYSARTASGHDLAGVVHNWQPPRQFSGTVEDLGDALMRVQLYGGAVSLWLSTYRLPEADVRVIEQRWQEALDGLFST